MINHKHNFETLSLRSQYPKPIPVSTYLSIYKYISYSRVGSTYTSYRVTLSLADLPLPSSHPHTRTTTLNPWRSQHKQLGVINLSLSKTEKKPKITLLKFNNKLKKKERKIHTLKRNEKFSTPHLISNIAMYTLILRRIYFFLLRKLN